MTLSHFKLTNFGLLESLKFTSVMRMSALSSSSSSSVPVLVPVQFQFIYCLIHLKFLISLELKTAAVCPLDKGEPVRTVERNYRPVSTLSAFSKMFEKILKEQLSPFPDNTLSIFIAAYIAAESTQHVLIQVVEEWKSKLDNNFIFGSCIPHDLIAAKHHAYCLTKMPWFLATPISPMVLDTFFKDTLYLQSFL